MTPIQLVPPLGLYDDFVLSKPRMENLQKYIESGVRLPVNTEAYQKQLSLDAATLHQFRTNIAGIVGIYGDVRVHCKDFKDNIFPLTVGLAASLCKYSKGAEKYYELIHTKLKDLFDTYDGTKRPNPPAEKTIRILVAREVTDITLMRQKAELVLQHLRWFEGWTVDDESAIKREKISLERELEGQQEYLTKRREDIAKWERLATAEKFQLDAKGPIANWCQIPFIGWVPATFLSTAHGMEAAADMLKYLSKARRMSKNAAKVETLANMVLQGDAMLSDLKTILEMIGCAITSIESMQSHFGTIHDDLMNVADLVKVSFHEPSDLDILECDFAIIKDKWVDLGRFAHHYRQVAWISPIDAQQLVVNGSE